MDQRKRPRDGPAAVNNTKKKRRRSVEKPEAIGMDQRKRARDGPAAVNNMKKNRRRSVEKPEAIGRASDAPSKGGKKRRRPQMERPGKRPSTTLTLPLNREAAKKAKKKTSRKQELKLKLPRPTTLKRFLDDNDDNADEIVVQFIRAQGFPLMLSDISPRFARIPFALWIAMMCAYNTRILGRLMSEASGPVLNGKKFIPPPSTWQCAWAEVLEDHPAPEALRGELPCLQGALRTLRMVQLIVNHAVNARKEVEAKEINLLYGSPAIMKQVLYLLRTVLSRLVQFKKLEEKDLFIPNLVAEILYKISVIELDPNANTAPAPVKRLMISSLAEGDNLKQLFRLSASYITGKPKGPLYGFGAPLCGFVARMFAVANSTNVFPGLDSETFRTLNLLAVKAVEPAVQKPDFCVLTQSMCVSFQKPFKTFYNVDRRLGFVGLHAILRRKIALSASMRSFIVDTVVQQLVHCAKSPMDYVVNASHRHLGGTGNGLDLVYAAISTEKVVDELLLGKQRNAFLSALENILTVMSRASHTRLVLNPVKEAKHMFGLASKELDFDPFREQKSLPELEKKEENRVKAFAFTLKIMAIFDTNVLHALTTLKSFGINRLFTCMYRLQRATDRYYRRRNEMGEVEKVEIVSVLDANIFASRLNFVREQILRIEEVEKKVIPKPPGAPKNTEKIIFPKLQDTDLAKILGRKEKILDFEHDPHNLSFLARQMADYAGEALARFDLKWDRYPRWSKMNRNTYVGNAKSELNAEDKQEVEFCKCLSKGDGRKCREGSCENISMKIECSYKCGMDCMNRRLQKEMFPKASIKDMGEKGLGFIVEQDLKKGDFIAEYCGEVVNTAEFQKRCQDYSGEKHFYFMALTKTLTIDASRRSSIARFINHSCEPNAEAEKWIASCEPRVVIVAKDHIKKGTEITMNYDAVSLSAQGRKCLCQAPNCKGELFGETKKILSNRSNLKSLKARKMFARAALLAAKSVKMINYQKGLIPDGKAVVKFVNEQEKKLEASRKPAKVAPPVAAVGSGSGDKVVVHKKLPKLWGFEKYEEAKKEKEEKEEKEKAVDAEVTKYTLQPYERKEQKLKRLGYIIPNDGTSPWKKKHKSELELKIAAYDSDVSDYSEITAGGSVQPVEEDRWEYDIPEVFENNPYANNRDKGRYGSPIDRIDHGKDSGLAVERNYLARKEEYFKRKKEDEERRLLYARGGHGHPQQQHMQYHPQQQQMQHHPHQLHPHQRHHQGRAVQQHPVHPGSSRPVHPGPSRHPPHRELHGGQRHPQRYNDQHAAGSRHHPPARHHQDQGVPRHYQGQGGRRHHDDHGPPRHRPDNGAGPPHHPRDGPRRHQDGGPPHHQNQGGPRDYGHQGGPRHHQPRPGGQRQGHYGGEAPRHYNNGGGGPRHYNNGGGAPRRYDNAGGPPRHGGGGGGGQGHYGRPPPPGRHSHPGHGHRRGGPPPPHHRNSYGGGPRGGGERGGGYPPNRRPHQRR